jgi:hypothetical protein
VPLLRPPNCDKEPFQIFPFLVKPFAGFIPSSYTSLPFLAGNFESVPSPIALVCAARRLLEAFAAGDGQALVHGAAGRPA